MRKLALSVMILMSACGSAAVPTPSPIATLLSTAIPTATPDAALATAVEDGLATIDAITEQLTKSGFTNPSPAVYGLLAEVATSGRQSLGRQPARVTTRVEFHKLDLILQLFELNAVLQDSDQLQKDYSVLILLRPDIEGLAAK